MISIVVRSDGVIKMLNKYPKELDKFLSRVINRTTHQEFKRVQGEAYKIAWKGTLAQAIYPRIFRKQGSVEILPAFINQAKLLEYGPQAVPGYPQVRYLGATGNQGLREWAQAKIGKSSGKLTIGQEPRTRFGKPSHKFISNAKVGRRARLKRIVEQELRKLGGK